VGADQLNDRVYDDVRAEIEQKRQRVVIGPWRMPDMNKLVPIGLGAAAVVVVLVVGTQFFGPRAPAGVGAAPSATPEPSVAAPSSATDGLPVGPFTIVDDGDPNSAVRTTVTIPASGWTANPEFGAIGKGEDADPPEAAMLAWSWPAGTRFDVYQNPCKWASTRPDTPATTVDEIVTALASQASRDASDPVLVTVGGYAGQRIILHVPNDAEFADCDQGNFASYGEAGRSEPSRHHQGPGQVDELWVLDVDGAIVILDAMHRPNTPAGLIEELRGIAESATFEPQSP
jgi:hypothetical protein